LIVVERERSEENWSGTRAADVISNVIARELGLPPSARVIESIFSGDRRPRPNAKANEPIATANPGSAYFATNVDMTELWVFAQEFSGYRSCRHERAIIE